jgi:hypothetical protein
MEGDWIHRFIDLRSVVRRLTAHVDLVVQVWSGAVAGGADGADGLAGEDCIAGLDPWFGL